MVTGPQLLTSESFVSVALPDLPPIAAWKGLLLDLAWHHLNEDVVEHFEALVHRQFRLRHELEYVAHEQNDARDGAHDEENHQPGVRESEEKEKNGDGHSSRRKRKRMKLKVGRSAVAGRAKLGLLKKANLKKAMPIKKRPVDEEDDESSSGWETDEDQNPQTSTEERKVKGKIVEEGESGEEEEKESDEDEEDEGEDDEGVGLSHKEQLAKLKQTDPELFKYLQSEESDLLDFGEGADEDEEDEGEDEEMEEEEAPKEKKSHQPKAKKEKDGRSIFDGEMYLYVEKELEKENTSHSAVRLAVHSFTACVARVGADIEPPPWVINDQKVFDAVVRLCFRYLGERILNMLGKPKNMENESYTSGKLRFPHFKKHAVIVKQYLHGLLLFLSEVQSSSVVTITAKAISALTSLFAQLPKLCRMLVKALVRLWTRKTLEERCAAYFAMNSLVKAAPDQFAILYKSCYMGFVSCSRDVSPDSWPLLVFMHRSFAQLTLLNPNVAYQYAFVYIRQTAIHIRNAVISNKRKDLVQSVYNWQLMQCLYMWTRVISHAHSSNEETEALRELAYPLVQIVLSTLKLFPSPRYLPLRAHCVELLLQLQATCDKYIPTLSLSVELMSEMMSILRSKPRQTKIAGHAPDLASMLKATTQQVEEPQWRKAMVDEIFRLLVQSSHVIAAHPAFPDVVLPLVHRLRSMIKGCKSAETCTMMKNLCDKLKEHSDWVRATLAPRHVDITDSLNIIGLRSSLRNSSSPLAAFHQQWIRYWKMKQRLLTKSDANPNHKEEKKEKVVNKKEEKKSKKARVEEEEEDSESDEEEVVQVKKSVKKANVTTKKKGKIIGRVNADASLPDQVDDLAMTSSEEDPRSKRGGYRSFDHSDFPDAVILAVRRKNFFVSASIRRYELDFDPHTFGDLLDTIYPCYKKSTLRHYFTLNVSSSLVDRLTLALQLQFRFAVKRIIMYNPRCCDVIGTLKGNNGWESYSYLVGCKDLTAVKTYNALDPLPVSTKFPDSTTVIVQGVTILVSGSTLSLHSPILSEILYKKDPLTEGLKIDVDPRSFITFLQATTGIFPPICTSQFLDDLIKMGAKFFYEYYMSEIRKRLMILPNNAAARYAMSLLEHYANRPIPDINNMKNVVRYLSQDKLDYVLFNCAVLSHVDKEALRRYTKYGELEIDGMTSSDEDPQSKRGGGSDVSTSLCDGLTLALQLQLRFAVHRLIMDNLKSREVTIILQRNNAWNCYSHFVGCNDLTAVNTNSVLDPLLVTTKFPDLTKVFIQGVTVLVSASTLSLHSPTFREILYNEDQLPEGVKIDVDPCSFITFLQATTGIFPTNCTSKFLDDLLLLGAKPFYEYYISEIRKRLQTMKIIRSLLEHYSHQQTPDMNNMKSVVRCLSRDKLNEFLSNCSFLSYSDKETLRRYREMEIDGFHRFQIFYLVLHSPFFYDLFYGPNSNGLNGRYELDFDPHTFGDLLDMIYPCYKKTSCCVECSSSLGDRLSLAIKLQLTFAVKRLIIENPHGCNDIVRCTYLLSENSNSSGSVLLPVSIRFPDAATVIVKGVTVLVSASTLSLHSSIPREILYKKGQLVIGAKIDVDPHSFITFLQATTGNFPSNCTTKFLDELLILSVKPFYEYYISEIRKKIMILPSPIAADRYTIPLLEHYANQPTPDMNIQKNFARYLSRDKLEIFLSNCASVSHSDKEELRRYMHEELACAGFTIFVRRLTVDNLSLSFSTIFGNMSFFSGKVVIVTGSSNGIGRGTAVLFAKEGAKLTVTGRNAESLEETKKLCLKAGAKKDDILELIGEITDAHFNEKLICATVKKFGRLDVLVNNAGGTNFASFGKGILDTSVDEFDQMMDLNVKQVLRLSKYSVPHLEKTNGAIVNVSSISAFLTHSKTPYYSAAKSALDQITVQMAGSLIKKGIRVNSVNPGPVATNVIVASGGTKEEQDKLFSGVGSSLPLGRIGTPDDIGKIILFLANRTQSEILVGHIVAADGGLSLKSA
uniref:Nucleolar complex protein 2 homolog n=1 Tax=Pristionchus pacificus TaxID=54126 RepID=A0A2A6B9I0_PRIPA